MLDAGRVVQIGTPDEIRAAPASPFVAALRRRVASALTGMSTASLRAWRWRCALLSGRGDRGGPAPRIVVGAKKFTESAILGELMAQVLETHAGATVERRFNLAGTQVCFDGLRTGAIDVYAEYTGTGLRDILGDDRGAAAAAAAVFAQVSEAFRERFDGLIWLAPFGFDNTYVLIMRPARAGAAGHRDAERPRRASAALRHVARVPGSAPTACPACAPCTTSTRRSTVGMEHDLAYQALAAGAIDVADGYSTDAKIRRSTCCRCATTARFFPPYEAAPLARADLFTRVPARRAGLAAARRAHRRRRRCGG